MRCNLKFLILICSIWISFQSSVFSQAKDSIYSQADTLPNFEYKTYISLEEKFTEFLRENSKQKILKVSDKGGAYKGLVFISFVVEKDGELSNLKLKTFGMAVDKKELQSLVMKTGKWKPGYVKGNIARVLLTFPIHVKVE